MGCSYKNTHILAATHHRILNLLQNLSLDKSLLLAGRIWKLSYTIFKNINENIRNKRKMIEKYTYKITQYITCYLF